MPALLELNQTSEWIAHELRVMARERGWLAKRTGVESLFSDRKGALQIITREFSGANLLLRSSPDMALRSRSGTFLVEAKAADTDTPNISIELYQFLLLRSCAFVGSETWYCFGLPDEDDRLFGWMVPVSEIRPWRIDIPARVSDEWHQDLLLSMNRALDGFSRKYPEVEIKNGSETRGSGDPYALVRKIEIEHRLTIDGFLDFARGGKPFNQKERISWEGKKEAGQVWSHIPRSKWKVA